MSFIAAVLLPQFTWCNAFSPISRTLSHKKSCPSKEQDNRRNVEGRLFLSLDVCLRHVDAGNLIELLFGDHLAVAVECRAEFY